MKFGPWRKKDEKRYLYLRNRADWLNLEGYKKSSVYLREKNWAEGSNFHTKLSEYNF